MKFPKLISAIALCVFTATLAQADVTWNFDSGASGSGPYPVDTPVDAPIQSSSQLSLILTNGVTASIASGATTPASGNYLLLSASSQAINSGNALVFTLNATGALIINALSYDAIVFMQNQGPDQITWTYNINYGSGNVGPYALIADTFKNKGDWASYNPDFNLITTNAATITILGALSGTATFASDNGSVGFDNFAFNVTALVPEPSTWALLCIGGLALVVCRRKTKSRSVLACSEENYR